MKNFPLWTPDVFIWICFELWVTFFVDVMAAGPICSSVLPAIWCVLPTCCALVLCCRLNRNGWGLAKTNMFHHDKSPGVRLNLWNCQYCKKYQKWNFKSVFLPHSILTTLSSAQIIGVTVLALLRSCMMFPFVKTRWLEETSLCVL